MNISKILLPSLLIMLASAAWSQSDKPPLDPRVTIKQAPLPTWLQRKFSDQKVIASGVAPFGTNQRDVWVVCCEQKKTKAEFVELWEKEILKGPHRLLHADFQDAIYHLLSNEYSAVRLCWLFPAKHSGPVVATLFNSYQRVYTFENGWNDPKPIIQKIEYISGDGFENPFDFDSVDERGIAQGTVFVFYHMSSEEDEPGANYALWWHRGQGWFDSTQRPNPNPRAKIR